ncbi:FAD-dependent oxidoreductase [Sulfurimonas sp.]
MKLSRRDALKVSGAFVAATAINACNGIGVKTPAKETIESSFVEFPKGNMPRVVVVGGGWSGLSLAKQLKIEAPQAEIILVEQRFEFISCPMSNLWLVDKIELEYLTHDYLQGARENNYTFFQASAYGIDKKQKILKTSNGDIEYDYLALAPGIDYDYSAWGIGKTLENRLRNEYPAAFKPGSEHMTLKNKIANFQGGNFIFTVPAGNYRCLPAPYERACMVADYFKSKGLKAKVILLDENNDITIKEHGFHTAMQELYKDYLEYVPNAKIQEIDLENKRVITEFDEFTFEDASFYPHVRGAKLLGILGFAKDTIYNRMEANIDPFTYEVIGEENIFVSGDARPMGFSKSGNTSNTEAKHVARLIARKINKQPAIKWESPVTVCISLVSIKPERGIFIHSEYAYNQKAGQFEFATPVTDEIWRGKHGEQNAASAYDWANAMYLDMFN